MTGTPSHDSTGHPRSEHKTRLAVLLAEMLRELGPDEAHAVLSEAAAAVLPPLAAEAHATRDGNQAPGRAGLRFRYPAIIGESPAIVAVLRMVDRIADADLPVLITGESGTGKELIARAIHENGNRAGRAFVRENCAAIPETLLESELFGYRRGAFTGALHDKRGLFEEGDGGCVFLDEIGEMPLSMQAKLMRVLQEGEIRPVGSPTSLHVDIRLISATNRDLRDLVARGRFREDLFFRLNVVPIHVPPLRERREDIPILVETFLVDAARRARGVPKELGPGVLDRLCQHSWPGNVRELQNEIARAHALSGPSIQVGDLSPEVLGAPPSDGKPPRGASKPRRP